jgi:hypothetical protein
MRNPDDNPTGSWDQECLMHRLFSFAATFFLLVATPVWAQDEPRTEGERAGAQGLYQAEVAVNGQGEDQRQTGFARALAAVLSKLSGDRNVMGRPGVGGELRKAGDYVESYDYRQDQGTSAMGAPTFRTTLIVRFRQPDVEMVASILGLPVWPDPRPKPVVWIAIDDGSGPRLVGLQQSNAVRPLLDQAIQRGYRLGLPTGTAAEQALAGAIWRQDSAAVAQASSRYSPPMQLVGKVYRNAGGWKADWIFVDSGRELAKWSVENPDARRAIASGADGAADALVKRYAKVSQTGAPGTYRVIFRGIRSNQDYLRLSAALQGMTVVRRIAPVKATPDALEADLDLLSGLSGFQRLLGDGPIVAESGEPMLGQPPVFYLR